MLMAFTKRTLLVILILGIVVVLAWRYSPRVHFIGVSAVCYGFLLGWVAAWVAQYSYSRGRT